MKTYLFACVLLTGCTADPPSSQPMIAFGVDMAHAVDAGPIEAPTLSGVPASTPNRTVAIRGNTVGTEVVIETPDATLNLTALVGPTGDFCVDAPVAVGQTSTFRVIALGGNGRASAPVAVDVLQSPTAPAPAEPTCTVNSNVDGGCGGANAECSTACNGCVDDYLEPNNSTSSAPTLIAGSYPNLMLCPCLDDWYAFVVPQGGTIWPVVSYIKTANFDLDLRLYRAADARMNIDNPLGMVTSGFSQGQNYKQITWTADMAGEYYLKVTALLPKSKGGYSLIVNK